MLFKHNVYSSNNIINFTNYTMGAAEVEIAFKLSKNIFSHLKEIKRYIEFVIPAIELADTSFNNIECAGEFHLIADNAFAKYVFLDSPYSTVERINFENHFVNISTINSSNEGNTLNVLGSSIKALFWAINELITYNLSIRKNRSLLFEHALYRLNFKKKIN